VEGDFVKVESDWGEVIQGYLYSIEQELNMLVIETVTPNNASDCGFRLISKNSIKNISIIIPEQNLNYIILPDCDIQKSEKREVEAVNKALKSANKIGHNITRVAQEIFNAIQKIYEKTEWRDQSIVVMNDVIISPPYEINDCKLINERGNSRLLKICKQTVEDIRK